MSRTKHWALGAVIAALCSFAYAKVPGMPHGGGGGGYAHTSAQGFAARGSVGNEARYDGANVRPSRGYGGNAVADRNAARGARGGVNGGANLGGGYYANGFGGYNPGARRVAGPVGYSGYQGEGRSGMQYAGAITPVSAESRSVPRPPANAPVRTGSIRADVARYNEERGSSRVMQRQADDPRQPDGSPYRN
ncbi:hypothetical protein PQQ51_13565 [Paraburkholderia xenovorans]